VRRRRGTIAIVSVAAAVATLVATIAAWPSLRVRWHVYQVRKRPFDEALAAARRLGASGPAAVLAVSALAEARLEDGPEREMLYSEALRSVWGSGGEPKEAVRRLFSHPDGRVRALVADLVVECGLLAQIERDLRSDDRDVRFATARAVRGIEAGLSLYKPALEAIIPRLHDRSPRLSTLDVMPGPNTVDQIASETASFLTGFDDMTKVEAWWRDPATQDRTSAELIVEAFDHRGARLVRDVFDREAYKDPRAWEESLRKLEDAARAQRSAKAGPP
jgi:hypothetical protein